MPYRSLLLAAALAATGLAAPAPAADKGGAPDVLIADFEGNTYGDWKVEGTAFGPGPAHGTLPSQMPVSGYLGHGLVNSFYGLDAPTGRLTSPPFAIQRRYINFLIGGGKWPGQTCMNLIVDGRVVATATGPNGKPGGSERLDWSNWDVGAYLGRQAVIEIVDSATDGWGHINVDHIFQSDTKLEEVEARMRMTLAKRWLNLPVKNGAPKRTMALLIGGKAVREFDVELAVGVEPDWWAAVDLAPFLGQRATLRASLLNTEADALKRVVLGDERLGMEGIYHEPHRPQFHFSTCRGWTNDPNGLVYYDGEYHLFFQHDPFSRNPSRMHWGHAISRDLLHWQELPVALYPDAHGACWSGSAVVDEANTAGFQRGAEKTLVCIYAAAGDPMSQCIAYSTDRGRTWATYDGNPVLGHIIGGNRDPKVIWYAPESKWVMALFLDGDDFGLFQSRDLKAWEPICDVKAPGVAECPEFFEISLDGDPAQPRWVFYGGNGNYLVGRFDGRTFTPEAGPVRFHYGNCFYASQTFNDIPKADGRRIQIAWGTVANPDPPYNQQMLFPVGLTLKTTPDGPRLFVVPVREIQAIRGKPKVLRDVALRPGDNPLAGATAELLDLDAEIEVGTAEEVGFVLRGTQVVYSVARGELSSQGCTAPLKPKDGVISLRILVDRTTVEIYANDGAVYMPVGAMADPGTLSLEAFARDGEARLRTLRLWPVKSVWPGRRTR
jgi:fructan beta-fructosidase